MRGVLTVTLNPAVDASASVEQLVPARKLRCENERRDAGGGGVNVARVGARLGADVVATYTCGGVVGQLLDELVAAEGVPRAPFAVSGQTRESINIFERSTGREYRFIMPGPTLTQQEWLGFLARFDELLGQAALVVLSGSLPPGAPGDAYATMARAAKARGARVVLDASGAALKAGLDEGVFLIKPSLDELREFTGEVLRTQADRLRASRRLIEARAAEIVVLSLSGEGALLVTGERAWRARPPPAQVMSTIGAGDSFVGAMVWAIGEDRDISDAFRYGVAAGTAALLSPGTRLCLREDVLRLFHDVRLEPA
jgi:6-phosphofructokinase 2